MSNTNNEIDFISDKIIEDALNIEPLPVIEGEVISAEPTSTNNHIVDTDFNFSRDQIKSAISIGSSALSDLATIASQSQRASAYEVVATLMKNVVDSSTALLDLSKKKKEVVGGTTDTKRVTNNNLFVGTTQELQKFLKERNS